MDSTRLTPLDEIKECIKERKNFVLQGGAGSGKTETLKETIEFISKKYPNKKIACITHTNLAAEEIKSRVGDKYTISTIHSFLNEFIKNYQKNIQNVLFDIFKLEKIEPQGIEFYDNDEKKQRKKEHETFKKLYEKYAKQLFKLKKENIARAVDKRTYEKDTINYNNQLNRLIDELNEVISEIIQKGDFREIEYNETKFDSLRSLTFGHDSLLIISNLLFSKHKILGKILNDKFDFIFIDEYQDTSKNVIEIFLDEIPNKRKTVVGLFGDSMQGIYEEGIGDVNNYISSAKLYKIEKEDNYRCSKQVIDFINQFRNDGLEQKVEFKYLDKEKRYESIKDREGVVKLYYSIYDKRKPHSSSSAEEKDSYLNAINQQICEIEKTHIGFKKLMLTNKSISIEVGFSMLYEIFRNRYQEVKDEIEKLLLKLQLLDLAELYTSYRSRNYNDVILKIRKAGFTIRTVKDKETLKQIFEEILKPSCSAIEALELAFSNNILVQSEAYQNYILRKNSELEQLEKDEKYMQFKKLYEQGANTVKRMTDAGNELYKEEFEELEYQLKKEWFYRDLFSEKLNFTEILNYYNYLKEPENRNSEIEKINYMTMHMTKGSGIENVMVIADEYFWSKYGFKCVFEKEEESKYEKTLKLFYVACSRTKSNLIIVRLISKDEENTVKKYFENCEEIKLN